MKYPNNVLNACQDSEHHKIYTKSRIDVHRSMEKKEWFEITVGVRQGCIKSLLLFLILIDYIHKHSSADNSALFWRKE